MNSIYKKIDGISIAALDVCVFEGNKYLITRVNVPHKHRRKGIATLLMKEICEEADKLKKVLCLQVMASGDMNDLELSKWYRKFGFYGYRFMKRNFKNVDIIT